MRALILLGVLVSLVACDKWAVLVAGSNTWANYRHQADVFHAYQMLVKDGFPKNRIITLAYDDIATNAKNPFKGRVFNKPTYKDPGLDVYGGVQIDYSKTHVTPEIFLAVLNGDKAAVKGVGTGRVLESTSQDNVFIFFSDHGAPGLIAFPSKYLYADALLQTFTKMTGKYKKLVFYLEACESGSMFQKLPTNTHIYALSAANPTESSWATYCSPDDVIQGKHVGSCLGDLFSVNFVEETEKGNFYNENLGQQFKILQKMTSESHVMQWGDLSFQTDMVGDFIAGPQGTFRSLKPIPKATDFRRSMLDSRTVKLQILVATYARERTEQSFTQMQQQMLEMRKLDHTFFQFRSRLALSGEYDSANINFNCMRPVIEHYEHKCGRLSDYGLSFIKYFAQACQVYMEADITRAIQC